MENKIKFNMKMKLILISLKLNKLEIEALENISSILNININNIKAKGEIIKLIIEYIQNIDIHEKNEFENTLNIKIGNTKKNLTSENNTIKGDTLQNEENSESESSRLNKKMNDWKI